MAGRPPCVIDNGTGYTKMGFAGHFVPNYIVPSVIATAQPPAPGTKMQDYIPDLDFMIGAEAATKPEGYNYDYPIRHGIIDNWDNMEKYWQRCIYQYLRCDPEEHFMMLTEPPLNTPENREYTAEIMFETFNVPGLYIAVQAVLALCASLLSKKGGDSAMELSGTVIDSGDGVTHIIPLSDGYVIGSCIKHIPLAGRDVTNFMINTLRERGEKLPPAESLNIARQIKERHCYVCPDLVKEYTKYDNDPSKFKVEEGTLPNGKKYKIDVGYERFLGPEIFFSPEIFSSDFTTPLPEVVDQTIQACPIDVRRKCYKYISLSGGSTMYKYFPKRLERDIRRIVEEREDFVQRKYPGLEINKIKVKVITHHFQRFAVWCGGSLLASLPEFLDSFHTKAEYAEKGPAIARANPVFNSI